MYHIWLISDKISVSQEMFHGLRIKNLCKEKFMVIKMYMSKHILSGDFIKFR